MTFIADSTPSMQPRTALDTLPNELLLLVISLLHCFELASLVHNEFLHVHMLLKYSSHPLWLLFESLFSTHVYATHMEMRLLFESSY